MIAGREAIAPVTAERFCLPRARRLGFAWSCFLAYTAGPSRCLREAVTTLRDAGVRRVFDESFRTDCSR